MSVDFQHAKYKESLPIWTLVSDVCEGEQKVKSKKVTYLPKPNPDDASEGNTKRYNQYLARAVFYNVCRRTLTALVGTAVRHPPVITLPSAIDYLQYDASGTGVGLTQQAQSVLTALLKKGRHGLLVDFPDVGEMSLADAARMSIRANIVEYDTELIVNWRVEKVGGIYKLSLVVLAEYAEEVGADGFSTEYVLQYRVLKLIDGIYTQEVWKKTGSDWYPAYASQPRKSNGALWDTIPFVFVGSVNNDHDVDPSPLYDLASLNIAHYRNSADYEDSVFFVGQVQPWITGLTETWRDHLEANGIYIGSRTPILLPEGGQFGFAQASPNTLCGEAMDKKQEQMASLGARLLESGGAVKTATEAQGDMESEYSVLSLCAENVNKAYQLCLEWCSMFMGATGKTEFAMQTNYIESSLDPELLKALILLWQTGKYPTRDFWAKLREQKLIPSDKDDESIQDDLDMETATGVNLDAATGGAV